MKRLVIASLFATALLGAQAQSFTDQARVRSVDPQYENINVPRNECSSHWVTHSAWAPAALRGAPGYWAMSTVGLVVAGTTLCALLAWIHRLEVRQAAGAGQHVSG